MTIKNNPSLDHFSKRAHEWENLYQQSHFRDRLCLFVQQAFLVINSHNAKLLDYGCGTGTLAHALSVRYKVTAVDGSPGMISKAKELYSSERIDFQLIDPELWRGSEEKYDGIICSSVIEYVADDKALLAHLSSSLKLGGYLLISLPNGLSVMNHLRNFIHTLSRRDSDSKFAHRLYYPNYIHGMLECCSLEIQQTIFFEFPFLGPIGVFISRNSLLGMMGLIIAKKI